MAGWAVRPPLGGSQKVYGCPGIIGILGYQFYVGNPDLARSTDSLNMRMVVEKGHFTRRERLAATRLSITDAPSQTSLVQRNERMK